MSQQSNESKKQQQARPLFSAYNPSGENPVSSETAPSFGSFPSTFATKTSNVEKSAELAEQQRKLTGSAFASSSTSSAAVENKNSVGASSFSLDGLGKTRSTVPGMTAAVVKKDAIGSGLSSAFNASFSDKKTTFGATPSPFSAVQSDAKSKTPASGPKKDATQVSNPFASTSSFGNNESFGDPNSASFTGKSSFLFTNPNPSTQSGTLAAQQELAQKSSSSAQSTKPFSVPTPFGSSPFGAKTSSNTTLQNNTQPPSSVFGGFATTTTEKHNPQALTTFGGFHSGNKEPSQSGNQQRQSAFGEPNTSPFDLSRLGQRRPSNGQKKSVTFSVPLVTGKREITPSPSPSTSDNSSTGGMFNFPIQNKSVAESNTDPSKLTSSPFTFAQPTAQTNKEEASSASGLAFSVPKTLHTSSPFTFQKTTPTTNKESNTAGLGLTFQKTSASSDPKASSPFTFEETKAPTTGKETSTTGLIFTKPPQTGPLFSSGTKASTNIAPTAVKETSTTGLIFTKPPQTAPLFSSGTKASTNIAPPSSFAFKPTISPTSTTETSKTGLSSSVSAPSLFGNTTTSSSSTITAAPSSSGPTNLPFPTLNFEEKNRFSFATIIDDLVKNLNISAHQLQPLLSQTMQRYETITTPFPIDNITKKTKFMELPQEAQTMLLQLEAHIYGERQRSEVISRRLETMQDCLEKTKVDSMAQDVHVLHHRLNIQLHEMRKVVEATQYQLVHVSAGAQNMMNANNTHRWLFGYARDDDYFVRLSVELSERLDEYKKCIWEVEKMAESLQQTSPYSSHDVGKIIDAQNKVFLGLANKVATLHETVGQLRTA